MAPAPAKARSKPAGVRMRVPTWLSMPECGAWCFLTVPDSAALFGTRARVPVRGKINGHEFRSSLMPDGKGNHTLMVNKQMQQGGGFRPGDTVTLELEPDSAPRPVMVPPAVKKALAGNKKAAEHFGALAPSHKKRYVAWVSEAKQPETRARRIGKMLAMLAAGRKMN